MHAIKSGLRRINTACEAVFNHPVTGLLLDSAGTGVFGFGAYQAATFHQYTGAAFSGVIALLWARGLPRDFRRVGQWHNARQYSRSLS